MYDSFSESKDGSSHGAGRLSKSQESKSSLSQLLLDAANTLQGSSSWETSKAKVYLVVV